MALFGSLGLPISIDTVSPVFHCLRSMRTHLLLFPSTTFFIVSSVCATGMQRRSVSMPLFATVEMPFMRPGCISSLSQQAVALPVRFVKPCLRQSRGKNGCIWHRRSVMCHVDLFHWRSLRHPCKHDRRDAVVVARSLRKDRDPCIQFVDIIKNTH